MAEQLLQLLDRDPGMTTQERERVPEGVEGDVVERRDPASA
jgi:hypothetical protein